MVAESDIDREDRRRQVRLRLHPERATPVAMSVSGRWEGENHRGMLQGSGMVQRGSRFSCVTYFSISIFRQLLS